MLIRMLFQRAGISRLQRARVLICVPSAITAPPCASTRAMMQMSASTGVAWRATWASVAR